MDPIRPDRSKGDGIAVDLVGQGVAVFSHGDQAMSLFDPTDGRIQEVNDAWVALYGYSRDEAHGMRVSDVSAEPDATGRAVMDALSTGGARIAVRWHRKKDGTVFPVDLSSGTLRVGARTLMFAVMQDIGPRLRAEERLQRSEARFRALIEQMPVGVVVHAGDAVRYTNPCLRRMLGVEAGEEVGGELLDLVPPDDRSAARARIEARDHERHGEPFVGRLLRRDGAAIPVEVVAIPFELDGAPATLAMIRDVGERQAMQAQLLLSDRLSSLGRLAASVGHEINNPLTYILGNAQLLERDIVRLDGIADDRRDALLDRLSILEDGARRVRDIVRDLRALSGGGTTAEGSVDLCAVLEVCANMAEHELRHRARLVRDYHEGARVHANEARLGQVFLNLLVNAAHAIPEGRAADNEVRLTVRRLSAERVEVEVRDSGAGIPPELADRIWEPFFTTKETNGTGLGLSISHAIVTALGGTIVTAPASPRGTSFRVTLPCEPASEREPSVRARRSYPAEGRRSRRPRILIADDERPVAQVLRAMIDDCEVSIVGSGRAAVARLEAERFDVVLLDVRMDDGGGADVVRWMDAHDPGARARVVLVTGSSPEQVLADSPELEGLPLLAKPIDLTTLRTTLEPLLRGD